MENTWSWDNTAVDYTLLEKVNPVFNTAKMTLFQLAANGDRDAATLAESMGLTREATQNSANTKASPEQVLGGTIMLECRYRWICPAAIHRGRSNLQGRACPITVWIFLWSFGKHRKKSVR